jgi:hypothetical protein
MGKGDFSNKYLVNVLAGKLAGDDILGEALVMEPDLKDIVKKYASNPGAFKSDVPGAYLRLTTLGIL